jgi:hypothetical protein
MDGEKMFLSVALVGDHGKPHARVEAVRIVGREDGRVLYETERGARAWTLSFVTFESLHSTREAAELWCADRLEAEAAPILTAIAKLREQAAARVAREEVASV